MLKLIRNCFGTKQILITAEGAKINWQFLTLLCEVQKREGLRCGNKLRKRHLNWQAEKMNVRLAAQLLSCSVADSLIYCEKQKIQGFSSANDTAIFCKTINNCFDILNTRNIFSNSSFGQKISMANIDAVTEHVNEFVTYIQGLTLDNGRKVLHSERKTGFLGFIICLQNAIELFKLLFKKCNGKFKYLLTYKLSQDHLEVFFSALRSRGGFNNNPSAYQFCNAYRRLIVRHEISGSEAGNCMNFEGIEILHVGSCNKKSFPDSIVESGDGDPPLDHDYLTTVWRLSPFVEDTCKYISGFVSKSVTQLIKCYFCKSFLSGSEDSSLLSIIKNRGKLTIASRDVQSICHTCELHYRTIENKLQSINMTQFHNKIFTLVNTSVFTDRELFDHISKQDLFFNHRTEIIRLVIKQYLKFRIHHTNKQICEKDNYIRHKYTKLVLFDNQ